MTYKTPIELPDLAPPNAAGQACSPPLNYAQVIKGVSRGVIRATYIYGDKQMVSVSDTKEFSKTLQKG